jgi:ribosome biogenesis SPOUT family RNA methylase Rps3
MSLVNVKKHPLLIIEHCEPAISEWLLLEYKHIAKLWNGNLQFTRVTDSKTKKILEKLGSVSREKAKDLYKGKSCIVLDPQAKKPLTPHDCAGADALIIGGLLGYEKPQGRTKTLISSTSGFPTRHLGPLQLSIDGAAFVIKAINLGLPLKDIEIAKEIEIIHDSIHSTILPFGYPIVENKPVITPGLVKYLSKL